MVWAYVGTRKVPTGSGKTLSMMYDMRKYILDHKENPYKIVSNTDFSLREKQWVLFPFKSKIVEYKAEVITDKDQFFRALSTYTHTIFMADEMSIWADQYTWKDIPEEFYTRIKQLRKADIHFLYTVQSFKMVAPRLRAFTNVVIECEPYPLPMVDSLEAPRRPLWIKQAWRHPEYGDNVEKYAGNEELTKLMTYKHRRIWLAELKRTFPVFDTMQLTS